MNISFRKRFVLAFLSLIIALSMTSAELLAQVVDIGGNSPFQQQQGQAPQTAGAADNSGSNSACNANPFDSFIKNLSSIFSGITSGGGSTDLGSGSGIGGIFSQIFGAIGNIINNIASSLSGLFGGSAQAAPANNGGNTGGAQAPAAGPNDANGGNQQAAGAPVNTSNIGGSAQQKIVKIAESYLGSTRFRGAEVNYGRLACAQYVSTVLKDAGEMNSVVLNVAGVVNALKAKGWKQVTAPPFQPGDVVTWNTTGKVDSHVGIINNGTTAMSNSSSRKMPVKHSVYYATVCKVLRK